MGSDMPDPTELRMICPRRLQLEDCSICLDRLLNPQQTTFHMDCIRDRASPVWHTECAASLDA